MDYIEKYGFPHIDWAGQALALDAMDKVSAVASCDAIILEWLGELNARLGNAYTVTANSDIIYFSYFDQKTASQRLRKMSEIKRLLTEGFGSRLFSDLVGRNLVVEFDNLDRYYDYLTHFYELDEAATDEELIETPMSGGCMVSDGYVQIVLNHYAKGSLTKVFSHELMHVQVAGYKLPLWLNEGLATNAEALAGGQSSYGVHMYNKDEHDAYWTGEKIADFWSGKTFLDEQGNRLSYDLAYMVVQNLIASGQDIFALLETFRDDGNQMGFVERTGLDPQVWLPTYIRSLLV